MYEASFDYDMRVMIWRAGQYVEITAPFRRYYYGLDLRPYHGGR